MLGTDFILDALSKEQIDHLQCAQPGKKIAVITGDGCMHMEGIEIATAIHYQLPKLIKGLMCLEWSAAKQASDRKDGYAA